MNDLNNGKTTGAVTADAGAVAAALEGLFSTHEARVLGAISLFVGYLCIFFTKIMSFTQMYVGVLGIAALILLLLLLSKDFNYKSGATWLRCVTVIVIGLFLTSPQLYYAWTVSVAEARMANEQEQRSSQHQAIHDYVPPDVNINPPTGVR